MVSPPGDAAPFKERPAEGVSSHPPNSRFPQETRNEQILILNDIFIEELQWCASVGCLSTWCASACLFICFAFFDLLFWQVCGCASASRNLLNLHTRVNPRHVLHLFKAISPTSKISNERVW